jgi:hypothetical protein
MPVNRLKFDCDGQVSWMSAIRPRFADIDDILILKQILTGFPVIKIESRVSGYKKAAGHASGR